MQTTLTQILLSHMKLLLHYLFLDVLVKINNTIYTTVVSLQPVSL